MNINNCLLCGAPLVEVLNWKTLILTAAPPVICKSCEDTFVPVFKEVDGVYCLYEYNEAMRSYFKVYKFLGDVLLAHIFKNQIAKVLINIQKWLVRKGSCVVVPIPLHEKQLYERTFSQVAELLNAASIRHTHMLRKVSSETQSSKNKEERLKTTHLFEALPYCKADQVILFDDIKTTGTTLQLAKRCLKEQGVKNIICVALAVKL